MQVKLDNEVLFDIDATMLKILGNDLADPIGEIKRRLKWVIEHKCDQCFDRLEKEWMEKLRKDPQISYIPKSKQELASLIFSRPSYKNKAAKEKEASLVKTQ